MTAASIHPACAFDEFDEEVLPLLGAKQRRRRAARSLAIPLVACLLVLSPLAMSVLSTKATTTTKTRSTSSLDVTEDIDPVAPEDWTCESVDLGVVAIPECVRCDNTMCADYCGSGTWCDHFCGDDCHGAAGALCVLDRLSNLTETCALVDAQELNTTLSKPWYDETCTHCDYSAWCDVCVGDCPGVVARPGAEKGQLMAGDAAIQLNNIVSLCRERGLLFSDFFLDDGGPYVGEE
eukprot:CAMPEP_0198673066 /NCGR_PEP_ID=MMETSP1467-20131203/94402_1 /TAXON_ID=1462469 /ORGANISM="unid. sp., Strain CCMP2135" /LENGTH=235 /DNA_ID=CAMNT_0044409915 /DNA_START=64 /DNA_END=771 /DNA_ORIENTATION=+